MHPRRGSSRRLVFGAWPLLSPQRLKRSKNDLGLGFVGAGAGFAGLGLAAGSSAFAGGGGGGAAGAAGAAASDWQSRGIDDIAIVRPGPLGGFHFVIESVSQ